ncbi:MAG: glycine hydroxymethyltransferase [Simkaniaceae bacterium]
MNLLKHYLSRTNEDNQDLSAISFLAGIDHISRHSSTVAEAILDELRSQRSNLKLIASENYCSLAVQLAMGNLLTDKYSEGFIKHRFYAGCENVDRVEEKAVNHLKEIFGCDYAYVQPHSGADANLVAFWAIIVQKIQSKEVEKLSKKNVNELSKEEYEAIRQLMVNQTLMGMGLNAGGHLTHGFRHNVSSKMMRAVAYDVDSKSHLLDYNEIEKMAIKERPLILTVGYSAYSRLIDFSIMRMIADKVGAVLLVDMAHFAGLVAGGVFTGVYNPVPYADILTSTTHKTMRGPRGGMILAKKEFQDVLDKGCPLILGGPLPHVMASKAIAFEEALRPKFKLYAHQIVKNSKALAEELVRMGAKVITGGTDNHLMIIDVEKSYGLTGRQAELALLDAHLTVNRNTIPFDQNGAWYCSGIRIGTPALTTLGMKEDEMKEVAKLIHRLLTHTVRSKNSNTGKESLARFKTEEKILQEVRERALNLLEKHPLYPQLLLDEPASSHVS